jgi:sulfur transfer complex TusBCD TusB component (DsrH family)
MKANTKKTTVAKKVTIKKASPSKVSTSKVSTSKVKVTKPSKVAISKVITPKMPSSKNVVSKSSVVRKLKKSNSILSLENGIKILQIALKKKLSLSSAAKTAGRGKNYISDIKARLEENFKSKNITKELYSNFKQLNKEYEKSSK